MPAKRKFSALLQAPRHSDADIATQPAVQSPPEADRSAESKSKHQTKIGERRASPKDRRASDEAPALRSKNATVLSDRVQTLTAQYTTLLLRYLKAARGVERQKLGRRLKQASSAPRQEREKVAQETEGGDVNQRDDLEGHATSRHQQHGEKDDTESRVKVDRPGNTPATAVDRLNKEVQVLREMNLEQAAELHLLKSLLKSSARAWGARALAPATTAAANIARLRTELEARVQILMKEGKGWSQERSNVLGRLFRVPSISEGVRAFVADVQGVFDRMWSTDGEGDIGRDAEEDREDEDEDEDEEEFVGFTEDDEEPNGKNAADEADFEMEDNTMDNTGVRVDKYDFEDDDDDDAAYERYVSRLADSDTELSEDSSAESDHGDPESIGARNFKGSTPVTTSIQLSDDASDMPPHKVREKTSRKRESTLDLPSSRKISTPQSQAHATVPPKPKPISTTFLPSLSLSYNGYISGGSSDSERGYSGDERAGRTASRDLDAAGLNHQTRKNRMGQQARRALWEKKFGRGARHLQSSAADAAPTGRVNEGRQKDGKGNRSNPGQIGKQSQNMNQRSATTNQRNRPNRQKEDGNNNRASGSGANTTALGPTNRRIHNAGAGAAAGAGKSAARSTNETLHPSWAAAKRAKEAQQRQLNQVGGALKGKKIVF